MTNSQDEPLWWTSLFLHSNIIRKLSLWDRNWCSFTRECRLYLLTLLYIYLMFLYILYTMSICNIIVYVIFCRWQIPTAGEACWPEHHYGRTALIGPSRAPLWSNSPDWSIQSTTMVEHPGVIWPEHRCCKTSLIGLSPRSLKDFW